MRKTAFTLAFVGAFAGLTMMTGAASAQGAVTKISEAGPNDLRVLVVNSLRTALEHGMAGAEKVTGHKIVIQTGTAGGNLKDAIMSGQGYELALLTPEVNAELIKGGKAIPGQTLIATGRMGFAVVGDVKVDVSSPAAIKKTLTGAKSVVFSPQSSGRPSIDKMFTAIGVTEAMIKHDNSGTPDQKWGPGEYQVYLYPMSEIVGWADRDWKNMGAFPPEYQVPVVVNAITGASARDPAATKKLLDYLTGPEMTAILIKDAWTPAKADAKAAHNH